MTRECCESENAQRYVAGTLPETDSEHLEIHVLTCDECRMEVRLGASIVMVVSPSRILVPEGVTTAAEAMPAPSATLAMVGVPARTGRWLTISRIAIPVLAAAGLAMVMARAPSGIMELSEVTPPVFAGTPSRSTRETLSPVDVAMAAYAAGDYRRAVGLLDRAISADSSVSVAFYLGAARLVTGDAVGALRVLSSPRVATGSPYQADASFLAAKAHIRLRNADSAVTILRAIPDVAAVALHAKALADSVLATRR